MDTLTAAALQSEYQAYIIILVFFGMAILSMLAAGVFIVYKTLCRYPRIMITGGKI